MTRRRFLKIAVIVSVLVLMTGFGLFTTLFFNPFEADYPFDVSTLIPREVDFYVSKADLRADFDPLPRPVFADAFEASRGGRAVQRLATYKDLLAGIDVAPALEEVRANLAKLPIDAELLELFGGEDLAFAGNLSGSTLAMSEWVLAGRTNWIGKLGVELLSRPGWIGLAEQGITASAIMEGEDRLGTTLSGGTLDRPLSVARLGDVILVATKEDFVRKAHALEAVRGQDSFGLTAKYGGHVATEKREGDELELFVDYTKLAGVLGWRGDLPDQESNYFLPKFLGRLAQLACVRELIGTLGFGNGLALRANGTFNSELLTPTHKSLYRERGFDQETLMGVAKLAHADAGLVLYGHAGLGELLRQWRAASEEALISNLMDTVRGAFAYDDIESLFADFDAAFYDRFALVVRRLDYPDEGESGPPHDAAVVLAWTLVLWVEDRSRLDEIVQKIQAKPALFGIQGRKSGSPGIMRNVGVAGGNEVIEYWNPHIPGTGHLATTTATTTGGQRVFLLSNHNKMPAEMVQLESGMRSDLRRLADDSVFGVLAGAGLARSNLALWANPRAIDGTLRQWLDEAAGSDVAAAIDWKIERPRIDAKILGEQFGGRTEAELSEEEKEQLLALSDQEAEQFKSTFVAEHAGTRRAEYENRLAALEIASGVFVELALDEKKFDLFLRLVTPLD